MRHVNALRKRQLQHLISQIDGPVDNLHGQLAFVIADLFEFQELQLCLKWYVVYLKCADDPAVGTEFMNDTMRAKDDIPLWI